MRRRLTPFSAFCLLVGLFLAAIAIYPLGTVLVRIFFTDGHLDLSGLRRTFDEPGLDTLVKNTLIVVFGSSAIALVIGGVLAWVNERTDARMGVVTDGAAADPVPAAADRGVDGVGAAHVAGRRVHQRVAPRRARLLRDRQDDRAAQHLLVHRPDPRLHDLPGSLRVPAHHGRAAQRRPRAGRGLARVGRRAAADAAAGDPAGRRSRDRRSGAADGVERVRARVDPARDRDGRQHPRPVRANRPRAAAVPARRGSRDRPEPDHDPLRRRRLDRPGARHPSRPLRVDRGQGPARHAHPARRLALAGASGDPRLHGA